MEVATEEVMKIVVAVADTVVEVDMSGIE